MLLLVDILSDCISMRANVLCGCLWSLLKLILTDYQFLMVYVNYALNEWTVIGHLQYKGLCFNKSLRQKKSKANVVDLDTVKL